MLATVAALPSKQMWGLTQLLQRQFPVLAWPHDRFSLGIHCLCKSLLCIVCTAARPACTGSTAADMCSLVLFARPHPCMALVLLLICATVVRDVRYVHVLYLRAPRGSVPVGVTISRKGHWVQPLTVQPVAAGSMRHAIKAAADSRHAACCLQAAFTACRMHCWQHYLLLDSWYLAR